MSNNTQVNMYLFSTLNQPFNLGFNQFINSDVGLMIEGSGAQGPVVVFNQDAFTGSNFYILETNAPNNLWPSTSTVSFDGLISGYNMTAADFVQIQSKIIGQNTDPALGLVLLFLPPTIVFPPSSFSGKVKKHEFLNRDEYLLFSNWAPSQSPDVVLYRIHRGNKVIGEVSASSRLSFTTCFSHKTQNQNISITAVNASNQESAHMPLNSALTPFVATTTFLLPIVGFNIAPD